MKSNISFPSYGLIPIYVKGFTIFLLFHVFRAIRILLEKNLAFNSFLSMIFIVDYKFLSKVTIPHDQKKPNFSPKRKKEKLQKLGKTRSIYLWHKRDQIHKFNGQSFFNSYLKPMMG